MKKYIKLIRVKHYIKNLLIFLPIIFSQRITDTMALIRTLIVFILFCIATSIIYVINDIRDIEKDRNHPKKKNRPLASGEISKKQAIKVIIILSTILICGMITFFRNNAYVVVVIFIYIIMNMLYSIKLKNIPILDIAILATGFLLRVVLRSSSKQYRNFKLVIFNNHITFILYGNGKKEK